MKILAVVESKENEPAMFQLLRKAGIKDCSVTHIFEDVPDQKPSMKALRELKATIDGQIAGGLFDYVIASGETAARIVLDQSTVNISRMRGRDYEFVAGVKGRTKKVAKNAVSER